MLQQCKISKLLKLQQCMCFCCQGWHWARLPPNCLATAPSQPAMIAEGSVVDSEHASSSPKLSDGQRTPGQVLLLCWTHAVIGFGFFGVPRSDNPLLSVGQLLAMCLCAVC